MLKRIGTVVLPLFLTACLFDLGRCTYEHRTLVLTGALRDRSLSPEPGSHTVEVSLNETRDANPDFRVITAYVTTRLFVDVEKVELARVIQGDTTVLVTWTTGSTARPQIWGSNQDLLTSQPSHEQLVWSAEGDALILMVSVFGEPRRLAGRLEIREDGSWEHPYCS